MRYLLHRTGTALGVLAVASLAIFALLRVIPGDPVATLAGPDSTPEARAAIRSELGLDQPLLTQYLHWLTDLFRLDLGQSYVIGGDVRSLVAAGALNTVVLTLTALIVATTLAVLTATGAVLLQKSWLDHALAAINTVALALPTFATGLVLVLVFAVVVPILPSGGVPPDGFIARPGIAAQYLLLPATVLALPAWAALSRHLTAGLRAELESPHVLTAHAMGVSRTRLVWPTPCPTRCRRRSRFSGCNSASCWAARSSSRRSSPGPAWAG